MKDSEIIKSLELCANDGDCKECKINPHKGNYGYCTSLAIKAALDLINCQKVEIESLKGNLKFVRGTVERQLAEIERLQRENEILSVNADNAFQEGLNEAQSLYAEQIKNEIRAEAVKEFVERLKKKAEGCSYDLANFDDFMCALTDIDSLVKEFTEGNSDGYTMQT